MFFIAFLSFLVNSYALPTQQILGSEATLTAIPTTNHILILTPQAEVQLQPSSLKFQQPLVQHLAPVGRIDRPIDHTVVYVPNENIINTFPKAVQQSKQLETSNITNIVNQFVTAGQTVQAELQALQQQLAQGLENIIQPEQKIDAENTQTLNFGRTVGQFSEKLRQDAGRFYSMPTAFPQFYSNFDIIHTPLNPMFIQPLQAIRARNVVQIENQIATNSAHKDTKDLKPGKIADNDMKLKLQETESHERNTVNVIVPALQSHTNQKENEQKSLNSQFGIFLGSLEKRNALPEISSELNLKDANSVKLKEPGSESLSIAEALPAGLAISGEGGLAQAKPIGSALTGKDGVSYSAPSGTAIAGSSDIDIEKA